MMVKGDNVLENKLRKMIYNHIIAYPGVSSNILRKIFDLSDSALRYHLDYLKRHKMISYGLVDGVRCIFPFNRQNSTSPSSGLDEIQDLTSEQKRILSVIKENPEINQKEIVHRTKLDRFKVSENVRKLSERNIIKKHKIKKNVHYEYLPEGELKLKIIKRLAIKLLNDEIDEATFLRLKRKLGE